MQLTRLAAAALIALAPAAFASSAAFAVTEADFTNGTTSALVNLCGAEKSDPMATAALNFCHGFAQGAVSVFMEQQEASQRPKLFCFPNPAPSRTSTLNEFVAWAKANPEHMSERAADGLFAFLHQRFACGKK